VVLFQLKQCRLYVFQVHSVLTLCIDTVKVWWTINKPLHSRVIAEQSLQCAMSQHMSKLQYKAKVAPFFWDMVYVFEMLV